MRRLRSLLTQHHALTTLPLIGLFLLTGCQNTFEEPTHEPQGTSAPTQSQSDRSKLNKQQQSPSSQHSAIRFRALPADQFPEVVPDNGARHGYATILESLGSGGAAVDFDRDGWPDVIVAGGGDFSGRECVGKPVFVLRNLQTTFENTTRLSGIGTTRYYHHGICVADFDQDGFEDVFVTGFGGMQLFCNLGDGTFTESTAATNLVPDGWSASAAWGDFNHDGNLDVFVAGYVDWSFENDPACFAADKITRDNCSPKIFEPLPDTLLISRGDGTFIEQSTAFNVRTDGKALGVLAADLDADGFLDVYVGNDVMMNFLYRNDGGTSFVDWSLLSGAAGSRRGSPDASMGVDIVDFNGDGRFDIWAANFEMESFALYQNLGDMQFRHVSDLTGVSAIGGHYVGWGTAFIDLDLDGDSDTVVCNGNVVQHPKHSPTLQKMVVLENINGEYFEEVTAQAGVVFTKPQHGRGLAWTDWNRDGKVDLVTTPTHSPAQLLENNSVVTGHSLTVQLVGTNSTRQPIGTTVTLVTSAGTQTKQLIGGGSYASTSLAELHFGMSQHSVARELRIRWPDNSQQTVPIADQTQRIAVIQGRKSPVALPK